MSHRIYCKGQVTFSSTKNVTIHALDGDVNFRAATKNIWNGGEKGIFERDYVASKKQPNKVAVKEIELLTPLDLGSANDKSGKYQLGMIFGKTYHFKVKSYVQNPPANIADIKWMLKYHSLSEKKWIELPLPAKGDSIKLTMNEEDMCGRFIYVRAYINDPESEGEYKQWKHNRFRWFDRQILIDQIEDRKNKPWLANQNETPTCGIAAILYLLAKKDFEKYKIFVSDLHRTGIAKCNDYKVNVNESLHLLEMNPLTNIKYPNYGGKMPYADWIPFSCIRDKENGVRDYDGENDESFDGSTLPRELKKLMKEILILSDVTDNTNVIFNKGTLIWDGEDSSSRELQKCKNFIWRDILSVC